MTSMLHDPPGGGGGHSHRGLPRLPRRWHRGQRGRRLPADVPVEVRRLGRLLGQVVALPDGLAAAGEGVGEGKRMVHSWGGCRLPLTQDEKKPKFLFKIP